MHNRIWLRSDKGFAELCQVNVPVVEIASRGTYIFIIYTERLDFRRVIKIIEVDDVEKVIIPIVFRCFDFDCFVYAQ